ncbi:glutathione S-transferase family protein [Marinobacter sp. KMM 10035]|uniref:glutathione S-transferase family protein n=1 Tax=Marinobacter sp. KMM 10035 TaxID=3134034 RepID=UPI00397DF73B
MAKKDQLLGWDVSPYTAKVRSYFNYKNIPYDYKPPNAHTLFRKVQPAVGKIIMPTVFRLDGSVLQDSSHIIDVYETENRLKPVFPETPKQALASLLVELFADEWLPMASLHYRWNYKGNLKFIIGEFGKNALPYFPGVLQRTVAKKFAGKMSGYLPILGITKKMEPRLEVAVENILSLLDEHFKAYAFLLGGQPTIGDFALYGQLYAHLHRDPEPVDLIKKYDHLYTWLIAMHGSFEQPLEDLPTNDQIPDTLIPVLQAMSSLQAPLLEQAIQGVKSWADENPAKDKIPQRLGDARLTIEGESETRYNVSYPYWMVQRINQNVEAGSSELKGFIQELGLASVFSEPLPVKVELKRARLYKS